MLILEIFIQFSLVCAIFSHTRTSARIKTLYEQIVENNQYANFSDLIKTNREAKVNLIYADLTVFIPENEAFNKHNDLFHSSLAFYHMAFEMYKLNKLWNMKSLQTVNPENPPLWITQWDDGVYINNAKILTQKSDIIGRSKKDPPKNQILHVIDEILDPLTISPQLNATCLNFLQTSKNWKIHPYTVTNYLHKIYEHKLQHIFQQNGRNTFLIPVDSGIDAYKLSMINKYTILGHVIPNYILFTRPSKRNFIYETMANGDYIFTVVMILEKTNKIYFKSYTVLGDSNNRKGEYFAEILKANIPVKNGVVHLISQPLGISERRLRPFPYLSIMEKISSDPELDITYQMGEMTGFNKLLLNSQHNFTFFITNDNAWIKLFNNSMEIVEDYHKILQRQLLITDTPYSIEKLLSLSRANNYFDFALNSVNGLVVLSVLEMDGEYFIKWQNKYIKVVRPNWECTNGIIHILDGPMTNLRKKPDHSQFGACFIRLLKRLSSSKYF